LLRTVANQKAARFGMNRAKWAVLVRLERYEGLKQNELAVMLDLLPISLTRLLDGLCDNGVIERRSDPADRRAKRLFLTPAARPLLQQLAELGEELMDSALGGLSAEKAAALLKSLTAVKENLRSAAQKKQASPDQRYG
jgi:MarR family transcriptional regulator for hemolysin